MEQMNVMPAVQTVSNTTVSTTQNTTELSKDQESFSDIYQKNVNDADNQSKTPVNKKEKPAANEKPSKESSVDEKSQAKDDSTVVKENSSTKDDAGTIATEIGSTWQNMLAMIVDSVTTDQQSQQAVETVDTGTTQISEQTTQQTTSAVPVVEEDKNQETVVETTQTTTNKEQNVVDVNDSQAQSEDSKVNDSSTEPVIAAATVQTNATAMEADTSNASTDMTETMETVKQADNVNVSQVIETPLNTAQVVEAVGVEPELPATNSLQQSVMDQIHGSLGKIIKSGENEIRLQLEPENLGVLNIRIIAGKDGTQVMFKTDNLQSSQLIAGQTDALKTMLTESGIKVDQVLVNDFSFSQQNFQNQQQSDQKQGQNYARNLLLNLDQSEQWENPYEVAQSVVGLNYLV